MCKGIAPEAQRLSYPRREKAISVSGNLGEGFWMAEKAPMDSMGDLLDRLRQFVCMDCSKESVERTFGWPAQDITVHTPGEDETVIVILFENGIILEVRYFLNEGLRELGDDLEFRLKIRIDLTSRVRYNVFYSRYIHGQGYLRISLGDVENRVLRRVLEDYYLPRLKEIYKPVIQEFRGFFSRDFFGVEADQNRGEIYYSSVRPRGEEEKAVILEVVSRLFQLEALIKERDVAHRLAELDLQMSFIPSVMWM